MSAFTTVAATLAAPALATTASAYLATHRPSHTS